MLTIHTAPIDICTGECSFPNKENDKYQETSYKSMLQRRRQQRKTCPNFNVQIIGKQNLTVIKTYLKLGKQIQLKQIHCGFRRFTSV